MASKNGSPAGLFVSTFAFNRLLMTILPALLMLLLVWSSFWSVESVPIAAGSVCLGTLQPATFIASCWHTAAGWMMAIGHAIKMAPSVWVICKASSVLLVSTFSCFFVCLSLRHGGTIVSCRMKRKMRASSKPERVECARKEYHCEVGENKVVYPILRFCSI
uniref:Uncharacterized protein n=1 Tax=Anopheles funestus TaxID=62324 RepID=A0A4Y0BFF9_ANOFN